MTAKQYNFTKQNDVVMKAKKRFTKQNGVVKQILAGWTKHNGVVKQVYSRDRISQPITFVPIANAFNYYPVYATVDAVYAVMSNENAPYEIKDYWDVPEITQIEYNGMKYRTDTFFNYAGGDTAKQSFLYEKSEYQYTRETNLADFSYTEYAVNGYVSQVSIKLGDQLYLMPFGSDAYYEVNTATRNIQTVYWDEALPVNMSELGYSRYGAITLSDGFGVMVKELNASLCVISYNQGVVNSYQTTLDDEHALGGVYTPNGQDVIIDFPNYYRVGQIIKFNPISGALVSWVPLGIGGVFGAYGGFVYYARTSTDESIAFYVDKYNISGEIVSTVEVPLPNWVRHPGKITTYDNQATKHSGRFAALNISPTHTVVFDLAKI